MARATCFAVLMALFAGAAAAGPVDTQPLRESITILVSPLQTGISKAVGERLVKKYGLAPPTVSPMLAALAIKAFCSGVGPAYPDIIGIPRRMAKREYDKCVENGVLDIIELPIGFDALVLAVRKGDMTFNMTPRAMYFALAAEIPNDDEFVKNPATKWSDLDPRLPDLNINVIGSEDGTSINAFFKEIFLEGGCRGLRQFKIFYSATDRVKACVTMRTDGRYVGIPAPISVNFKDAFKKAPPGAIAVLPYTVYKANADWLDVMPVLNVPPSAQTIKDDDYEAVSPVRYYVKRAHMEASLGGTGVVNGLYSFIEEIMSEDAIGPGGYLEAHGVVIDDPEDRQHDRDAALRLQPFRR